MGTLHAAPAPGEDGAGGSGEPPRTKNNSDDNNVHHQESLSILLAKLPNAKRHGEDWLAVCPAHNDQNASLSLSLGHNGSPVFHCHAGCSPDSVLAALGLAWRDVLPEKSVKSRRSHNPSATPQHSGKITAKSNIQTVAGSDATNGNGDALECTLDDYANAKALPVDFLRGVGLRQQKYQGAPALRIPYRNLDGAETAVRIRTALRKSQNGADNRFRWTKGAMLSLYGLWFLPNFSRKQPLFLVEGESDSHTLWWHRYAAVGVPGASNWREDRDAAALGEFETIYVVREPDKGGEALCEALSKSSLAAKVKVVTLGEWKDVSEMHVADSKQFRARLDEATSKAVSLADTLELTRKLEREAAWVKCKELALTPNILDEMISDLRKCGLVGEEKNAKLIYLSISSRVLPRIVSLIIKGGSSTGKSYVAEQVLKLFPPSAYYLLTACSEKALIYTKESFEHRILVVFEAAAWGDSKFGVYLMRSLLSEGRIAYDTVVDSGDGPVGKRIEKPGPTGLITTTTAIAIHPENETRLFSLNSDESQEQTKRVMLATADAPEPPDFTRWHSLQQWIEKGDVGVTIPFLRTLTGLIPPVSHRLRRDVNAVKSLISAHALVYQATRVRDADGRVVATIEDDYAPVRELLHDLIAEGTKASVSPKVRSTVAALKTALDRGQPSASLPDLEKILGLDKGTVSRRVRDAKSLGYIHDENDGQKGKAAKLTLGDPLPEDQEVLPSPEALRRAYNATAMVPATPAQSEIAEPLQCCSETRTEVDEPSEEELGRMADEYADRKANKKPD